MFRKYLQSDICSADLSLDWVRQIEGLVRVSLFDSQSNRAFVVVYREKVRSYAVIAYDRDTGETCWERPVINGGYGTPVLTEDAIVLPTQFTGIIALSKEDGRQLWKVGTDARVRSSLNYCDGSIYFSSGGDLYRLSKGGEITGQWSYPGAFFYGSIDSIDGLVISLGTVSNQAKESEARVFAFREQGELLYQLPLAPAPVISSDTSGIAWKGSRGFVGTHDAIIAFDRLSGQNIWTARIDGSAARQICLVDDERLYYQAKPGVAGALSIEDGTPLWQIFYKDDYLVSPNTLLGDAVVILADAHLNLHAKEDGQLLQRIPVGHSPYSMVSVEGDRAIVGAGEPPHYGLLIGFRLVDRAVIDSFSYSVEVSNAFVEAEHIDLLIEISGPAVLSVEVDSQVLGSPTCIKGQQIGATKFALRLPLDPLLSPGDYVFPLHFTLSSGECLARTVAVSLATRNPLPSRVILEDIPDPIQEDPSHSGVAIAAAVKAMHGDEGLSQTELREMVDFSLQKSGYEPFQIWRLVLRRILTTQASRKEELPEYQPKMEQV